LATEIKRLAPVFLEGIASSCSSGPRWCRSRKVTVWSYAFARAAAARLVFATSDV
jgi:hypothetical protein